jgi:hypothetical protein
MLLVPFQVPLLVLHEIVGPVATALLGEVAPLAADKGDDLGFVLGEGDFEIEFVVLVPGVEAKAAYHVEPREFDVEEGLLKVVRDLQSHRLVGEQEFEARAVLDLA